MIKPISLKNVFFAAMIAGTLSACGDGKPDLAAQQIAAAQGTCDNPIQVDEPGVRSVPSEAVIDGKDGTYQATKVSYFFDLHDFEDRKATHQINSTVTRTAGADPQYSLELACKKGDPQAKLTASILIPDTISRKDGTISLRTEKFAVDGYNIGSHSSETAQNYNLSDYLNRSSAGATTQIDTRIYKRSDTSFDISFSFMDFDFSHSNAYGRIHYELK